MTSDDRLPERSDDRLPWWQAIIVIATSVALCWLVILYLLWLAEQAAIY